LYTQLRMYINTHRGINVDRHSKPRNKRKYSICIHTYLYAHIQKRIRSCICIHIWLARTYFISVVMRVTVAILYICTYTYIYIYIYTYIYIYINFNFLVMGVTIAILSVEKRLTKFEILKVMCMDVYICIYIHLCVYMYT
jgi:hypothetical protein